MAAISPPFRHLHPFCTTPMPALHRPRIIAELGAATPAPSPSIRGRSMTNRHTFLLKLAGSLLLVALADLLFWFQRVGSTLGLFALAVLIVVGCMRMDILRRWPSRIAFAAALFFASALAADPGPLALLLYVTSLT